MRHANVVVALRVLGGVVAALGVLATGFLAWKGLLLANSQYGSSTAPYYLFFEAFAIGTLACLLGAFSWAVAALLEIAQHRLQDGDSSGAPLEESGAEMKKCPVCGMMLSLAAAKCSQCGRLQPL